MPVAEPDAVNPLGGHGLLGCEVREDARDVDVVGKVGFGGDECGGGARIFSLELEVELTL